MSQSGRQWWLIVPETNPGWCWFCSPLLYDYAVFDVNLLSFFTLPETNIRFVPKTRPNPKWFSPSFPIETGAKFCWILGRVYKSSILHLLKCLMASNGVNGYLGSGQDLERWLPTLQAWMEFPLLETPGFKWLGLEDAYNGWVVI